MNTFWDTRYDTDQYIYGKDPNHFFESEIVKLTPGKILLPGEGEGRNAVFAALAGWLVDAFDQSSVGAAKARQLALEKGVQINYCVCTLDAYHFPSEDYDAVGLIYFHVPPIMRKLLHSRVAGTLKPGRLVILEAFHTTQLGNNTGGPQSPELLFDREIIKGDFTGLETLYYSELQVSLDEGNYHQGVANIIRYVGKKKETKK